MLLLGIAMLQSSTSSSSTSAPIPVAYYDEIKDLPHHREKLLVDVREPSELQQTGRIPMSINVPCKLFGNIKSVYVTFCNVSSGRCTNRIFE